MEDSVEEQVDQEEKEVFVFVPPTKQVVEERKVRDFKLEED